MSDFGAAVHHSYPDYHYSNVGDLGAYKHWRTVLISDLHLGGVCNYSGLKAFLEMNDADTWYLVGDIVDFWALRRSHKWTDEASGIVQKLLKKARHGQRIILLPGNHDEELRRLLDFELGSLRIVDKAFFTSHNNKTFIVVHGDAFDAVVGSALWLSKLGAIAYDWLVLLNLAANRVRKLLGLRYWSFSANIKKAVKNAVSYVSDFEASLVELARQTHADGVVCGHIHTPAIKELDGVTYVNCGDWVESLSAVVEDRDGNLNLLRFDH